jgi:hypothetical protein
MMQALLAFRIEPTRNVAATGQIALNLDADGDIFLLNAL